MTIWHIVNEQTAVHTDDEVTLYQMIVNDPQKRQLIKLHDQAKKPDFVAFAQLWSTFCTGELKIYFKTARHLESYFNVMEDRRKYGDSVLLNIQKVQRMKNLTQNVTRSEAAGVVPYNPRPAPQELIRNNVFTVDTEDETETPAISSREPLRPLAPLPFNASPPHPPPQLVRIIVPAHNVYMPSTDQNKKKKKSKTCSTCKRVDCVGKVQKKNCVNMCGNCRLLTCTGRYDHASKSYDTFPCIFINQIHRLA